MSPGTKTFECHGGGWSVIDLILISESLKEKVELCMVDYVHPELFTGVPGRGHYPVRSIFKVNSVPEKKVRKTVYDLKSADWNKWSTTLDTKTMEKDKEFDEAVSPEDICCLLQNCIKLSEADVMETKILCQNSKPYWNSELTALSNNVRQARKVYRSNNSITNKQVLEECKAEFSDKLNSSINSWTLKSTENLNTRDEGIFWKEYAKQFKVRDSNTAKVDILINPEGALVFDEEIKAELFYETFNLVLIY